MEHNFHRKTIVKLMDTNPVDTGPVDTGPVDTGPVDTGPMDTISVDKFWKIGIEYNCNIFINNQLYQTYSISPHEVESFACGYCLTSGKLSSKDDILHISHEINHENEIVDVNIKLKDNIKDRFFNNTKTENLFTPFGDNTSISHENFQKGALKFVEISQQEKENNYSLHMGCWFNPQGELQSRCYDLSRHVALDKTLGKAYTNSQITDSQITDSQNTDSQNADSQNADSQNADSHITENPITNGGFLVMSSRAAHELLNKAINAGVKNIIFMSAPTTWAIKVSAQHNINLMVFFKNNLHTFTK